MSLVLFIIALRQLGTARSGAYFSMAPFVGAAISLALLGEQAGPAFWIAGLLMAAGLWLHLSKSHGHDHEHEALAHAHGHRHDAHHQHEHDFHWGDPNRIPTTTHMHPCGTAIRISRIFTTGTTIKIAC